MYEKKLVLATCFAGSLEISIFPPVQKLSCREAKANWMIIIAQETNLLHPCPAVTAKVWFSLWSSCVKTYPFRWGKPWAAGSSVCETGSMLFERAEIAAAWPGSRPLNVLLLIVFFLEWRVEVWIWPKSTEPDPFLAAWRCTTPSEDKGHFWVIFLLIVVWHCPGSWLAEGSEPSVEGADGADLLCSFEVADLEVDLEVDWFPLKAAETCIPLHATAVVPGFFWDGDCLSEAFFEYPVPVRTRRAFSRARSSNSISSFSPGEISVSVKIAACKHVVSWFIN